MMVRIYSNQQYSEDADLRRGPLIWDKGKSRVSVQATMSNSHFIPLTYVPQVGPQCGFSALCMIASHAGMVLYPDDLVSKAQDKLFTKMGEMFCARNMTKFAQEIFAGIFNVTLIESSMNGYVSKFKEYIRAGSLILLAYDCFLDFSPHLMHGRKAHWMVICGYVDGGSEDNFYLICCHGKSKYAGVWKFRDIMFSNDNLYEVDPTRNNSSYVIPEGNLKEALAKKWIVFERI